MTSIYIRATGIVLEKLLENHLLVVERYIQTGIYNYIPYFYFPMIDGSIFEEETSIKEFVSYEFYIVKILELSLLIPENFRPFLSNSLEIKSAICRCIERKYPESLYAICKYAGMIGLEPGSICLLPKYLPFDPHIYNISSSFGYKDFSYEGLEDTSDINISQYIGYRICFHIFYYMQPSRVEKMLEYWSQEMTCKNCTIDAIKDVFGSKNQVRIATILLEKLNSDLTPNQFISKYWEKGYKLSKYEQIFYR